MKKRDNGLTEKEKSLKSNKPLANCQALLDNVGGDQEIFDHFIDKIPAHTADYFEKLSKAVNNKKAEEIKSAAHALRGVCLFLEMYRVIELAQEIECMAAKGKLNGIKVLLSCLEVDLFAALKYIEKQRNAYCIA